MRRARFCVAPRFLAIFLVLVLALALAPSLAQARAGRGSSFGSRGSHSYYAPPATRTAPGYTSPLRSSAPAFGAANRGGVGLMHGILGGLVGAGLVGMFFGHGMFWGMHGAGGLLGVLIQIAIIVFIARWLWRRLARAGVLAGGGVAGMAPAGMTMAPPHPVAALTVQDADFHAFEAALQQVQAAWGNGDIAALQRLATPEMVATFAAQLQDLRARGLHNEVGDVRLLQGDLSEAWQEGGADFATVAMRFSMIDVTRDLSGRVVDGAPGEHVQSTELWTFTRPAGGLWMLSAIQQAG